MAHRPGPEAQAGLLSGPASRLPVLAARAQASALRAGVTVSTAESCTGGLVGHSITANPGSSAWYAGGVISYADAAKTELLGVPPETIATHGAVSPEVAGAMAEGVRFRLGTDLGVAVTGVAGPDGGSEAKPVGLTYVAVASPGSIEVRRFTWDGDRAANKEDSAAAALELLIAELETGAAAPAVGGQAGDEAAS